MTVFFMAFTWYDAVNRSSGRAPQVFHKALQLSAPSLTVSPPVPHSYMQGQPR